MTRRPPEHNPLAEPASASLPPRTLAAYARQEAKLVYPTRRPLWVGAIAALAPLGMLALSQVSAELMTVGAIFLILGVALGWGNLAASPAPGRTTLLLISLGAIGLAITRFTQDLSWLTLVAASGVLLAFLLEMNRGKHRPRASWSLSVNVTGTIIVLSGAAWGLASVYPTMDTLAVAALPATGVASLLISIPCKSPLLRTFLCALTGAATSAILTLTYLYQFPDLALAVPYAVFNPEVGVWIMTVGVGFLCGILVACMDVLFPIPKAAGYHLQQLTLALTPTLFLAVILYSLSRLVTG